jgi:hypothetical protein
MVRMADGTRATLIVGAIVAALFVGGMYAVWQFLSQEESPNKYELKLPTVSMGEIATLAAGESMADVFDAIGRGEHVNTKFIHLLVKDPYTQKCYLYRVEGGEPNDQGHFPLYELCFHDGRYAPKDGGRFRDDL